MAPGVSVEEVAGAKALARFVELPHALHGHDPRFAPLVLAWERYRLDPRRNPYFERGDAVYLLARRLGRPVGRITAQVAERAAEGHFGFWWVDDDAEAAAALLDAAATWLVEQGCTSMTGPLSFTAAQESGVQVSGHDVPGVTGRPWHPPHLAELLEANGFEPVEDRSSWRLPTTVDGPSAAEGGDVPGHAGAYGDGRLVMRGGAAVPDVADALRGAGLGSAWRLAKQARQRAWSTATLVRLDGDPEVVVPVLQAAAGRAGYQSLIAPWTAERGCPPETTHRVYSRALQIPLEMGPPTIDVPA
jgi:hypothetical protein